ncbi:MAG: hypothetical protein IKZ02_06460 [Alphaproteobacteria bacterium]|nr:hypothetical protein [Alphaproteobacteria bacterium]
MNETQNTQKNIDNHDNDMYILNQNGSITQIEPITKNEKGVEQVIHAQQRERLKTNG